MPLDIDGAGRSRSLACLPTARGTVAPTRVPGALGPSGPPSRALQRPPPSRALQRLGLQGPSALGASRRLSGASRRLFRGPPGFFPSRGLYQALKGIGLGGLPPGRRGVGDCVRWPSTFRPWQHLACSHALEGSSTPAHHILHGNIAANPEP